MKNPTERLTTNFYSILSANVNRLQAAGEDIIRLDIGSPDLPPADHIIQALTEAAHRADSHGYQSHQGTTALREAWAGLYDRLYGVEVDSDGIIALLGSKEGIFHLSIAVLNPGDIVLVPDPGYPTYIQGAHFAGADTVPIPLAAEKGYLIDFTTIPSDLARRTKLMWLNYPNNPTAAVASRVFFDEAVAFCRQNNILLCHDAAYTQVTFDGYRAPSILEVPGSFEVAVEFNTLSKSHNMAGWRVGAALGQQEALKALLKIKTHADSGHFLGITQAAVAALTGDQSWLADRNRVYQERRDVVISALKEMGFKPGQSRASLYVWFPIPSGWDSKAFVLKLLEEAHISLAPGSIFGPSGEDHVRLSLTQPLNRLYIAMQRLSQWAERRL
jgi:LL-diaminopimelate aminotransferase